MSQSFPKYKVKAGRFAFDTETKKVKISKDKGFLQFYTVVLSQLRMRITKTMQAG
jgi:hypothetical protein